MNQELFNALEALCFMWHQYCDGPYGHKHMSAGEHTEEVLNRYDLLISIDKNGRDVNWEKLEEHRRSIH